MKKILIPTDFSINARIAADYGMKLAIELGAEITLLHTYRFFYDEATHFINVEDKLEEVARKRLKQEKDRLNRLNPESIGRINTIPESGFLLDVLERYDKNEIYDLIVMGTKGATGLEELFIGTLTASALNRVQTPMLIVPQDTQIGDIDRITYAADYHELNLKDMIFLKQLAQQLNARIDVLKVLINSEKILALNEFEEMGMNYDTLFSGVRHEFHYHNHEDIEEGIASYLEKHPAQMLCVYARKHNFFESLFHSSVSKKLAYHTHVPLLVIKEN